MNKFAVRDAEGKLIAQFEATPETAAAIVFLIEEAVKIQTEKVKEQKKRAFDAGWNGAIRWTQTPYPGNLGNLIYVESLKKLFESE